MMAAFFKNPNRDSDVKKRWMTSQTSSSVNHFWGPWGADVNELEQMRQSILDAELFAPLSMLDPLLELGDNGIDDIYDIPMWEMDSRFTELKSIAALAINLARTDLLEQILHHDTSSINAIKQPLLHFAVTEQLGGRPHAISVTSRAKIVRLLLLHGANLQQRSVEGSTAFQKLCELVMSADNSLRDIAKVELLETVQAFLQAKQNPDVRANHSRYYQPHRSGQQSLLHYAAETGDYELVKALLEHKADVNACDDAGHTPLDCVCDGRIHWKTSQLSHEIDIFCEGQEPMSQGLGERIATATLLVSRGAVYNAPLDSIGKFGVERTPISHRHVSGLRARGIEIDDRIIWTPPKVPKAASNGNWTIRLNLLKGRSLF